MQEMGGSFTEGNPGSEGKEEAFLFIARNRMRNPGLKKAFLEG